MENEIEKIRPNVERQIENPDWDKIRETAKQKHEQFNGFISEEGALHLAIDELYPDYQARQPRKSGVTVTGRIVNKTRPRPVTLKKSGKQQPVRDVFIATEDMGVVQTTLFGKSRVEMFTDMEHGDAIRMTDVKVGSKNGETVINFFDNSSVEKIDDDQVPPMKAMLEPVDIAAVENSQIGTLTGVIIQVKDVQFTNCPTCNAKVQEVEGSYFCETHNEVTPNVTNAKEMTIDTGQGIMTTLVSEEHLNEGEEPKQMDKIHAVCRVYDSNYFRREKARKENETAEETLKKQFPVDKRLTVYSYSLEKMQPQSDTGHSVTEEAVQ